tara:strand:+ start:226 stop:423 length:198 start_codon:yes stop_codon:yes gene_type:complete
VKIMPVIPNPRSGDEFLNLLIVSGVDEETLQLMQRDIQSYVQSLSREEIREYQKVFRTAKAEYCR